MPLVSALYLSNRARWLCDADDLRQSMVSAIDREWVRRQALPMLPDPTQQQCARLVQALQQNKYSLELVQESRQWCGTSNAPVLHALSRELTLRSKRTSLADELHRIRVQMSESRLMPCPKSYRDQLHRYHLSLLQRQRQSQDDWQLITTHYGQTLTGTIRNMTDGEKDEEWKKQEKGVTTPGHG